MNPKFCPACEFHGISRICAIYRQHGTYAMLFCSVGHRVPIVILQNQEYRVKGLGFLKFSDTTLDSEIRYLSTYSYERKQWTIHDILTYGVLSEELIDEEQSNRATLYRELEAAATTWTNVGRRLRVNKDVIRLIVMKLYSPPFFLCPKIGWWQRIWNR